MADSTIETRVTGWLPFRWPGYSHRRIWQRFDGKQWDQRYELKTDDGSTQLEEWGPAWSPGWMNGAKLP